MKKEIRKNIIQNRSNLTDIQLKDKSHHIFENIISLEILRPGMKVLVYMDFRNEVMTEEINKYILNNNITLLLPKVNKKTNTLSIHKVDSLDTLVKSKYGILEPSSEHESIGYDEIDLILAPGVAFDKDCYRLGYGGGFYDKLISQKRTDVKVVALAFNLQFIDSVPAEQHDKKMDCIVTESKIIMPNK